MTLFKKVPDDRCTKQVGLMCGAKEADHPMNMSGYYHEFQPGATKMVEATREDIVQALRESTDKLFS